MSVSFMCGIDRKKVRRRPFEHRAELLKVRSDRLSRMKRVSEPHTKDDSVGRLEDPNDLVFRVRFDYVAQCDVIGEERDAANLEPVVTNLSGPELL
jgi:hypothetical protein